MKSGILKELSLSIVEGDETKAEKLVREALESKINVLDIFREGIGKGMDTVNKKYVSREYGLPDVLFSAKASQKVIDIVKPILKSKKIKSQGTIVIGTVKGDIHCIGKNLVATMLESEGFTIYNLGADVPAEKFIEKAKETNADVIAMSGLMSTSMPVMKEIVETLKSHGLGSKIIMIGGAPTTAKFAKDIGANTWANDAKDAVDLLKEKLKQNVK